MIFLLADSFQTALAKLPNAAQKAVKLTVFDLQQDPSNPGLKFHRIENAKDPNFWSVRVNRDIRLIVHKTASSFLIAYVDHHDAAYRWAERRRIDTHPRTGAAQLVEIRERVETIFGPAFVDGPTSTLPPPMAEAAEEDQDPYYPPLFLQLTEEDLLGIGVPEDWLRDVHNASENNFLDLADHIPAEAMEALLGYVADGVLRPPEQQLPGIDPFSHPDALRRFRVMDNVAALENALNAPWDRWAIFLHPDQEKLVEAPASGPVRIAGSAGTGKTVVALHRTSHLLRTAPASKLLLTSFSSPLCNALRQKLRLLVGNDQILTDRVSIAPFDGAAQQLFTLIKGYEPRLVSPETVRSTLLQAAEAQGLQGFTDRFLLSEWRHVVDAWQIESLEAYARVPRLGRKNRLGSKQRERLWPVFAEVRERLQAQMSLTPAMVFGAVTAHYKDRADKPFDHILVDEAQDLGVPALKMLAAIAPKTPDALFFAGDLGQRIFQEPFSWLGLGIDIRGRSHTLKVNYRTSHQIRRAADRLLPSMVRDVDGIEEDRRGTISVFNGPDPVVHVADSPEDEITAIGLALFETLDEGIPPEEIGVFVRSDTELPRARAAVQEAGAQALELSDRIEDRTGRVAIGVMHLAKGLEFRHVVVMACDEEVLPDQDRIETVADEVELDEVYETERQLFYVACTRARERLTISGVAPGSEFFGDLAED